MGRRKQKDLISITPEQERIGRQIAKIRKLRDMTQKDLAEKIGISRSAIGDYESGKNRIYDGMIIRLATVLGVTPNDILCFDKNSLKDAR